MSGLLGFREDGAVVRKCSWSVGDGQVGDEDSDGLYEMMEETPPFTDTVHPLWTGFVRNQRQQVARRSNAGHGRGLVE